MNNQTTILRNLKTLNFDEVSISLAVIKEYKRDRQSHYIVKYVPIDEPLERRLKNIIMRHVSNSNVVEEYSFDCPEPESDQVRAIDYAETDFYNILDTLQELKPEEDVIEHIDDLVKSKAYMIIVRNSDGIQVVGFKTLPENWKMKRSRGLIPLLYNENRFEDLENENIFSISSIVDLFYFGEVIFILSKKEFERGLNFRNGMINNAQAMFDEAIEQNIFVNMDILTNRVGNNQRYLRKIAMIKNLGYYKDISFLNRLKEISTRKGWNIQFNNDQIVITETNLDDVLILLQNKRLHSEITEEDFDVESIKLVNI